MLERLRVIIHPRRLLAIILHPLRKRMCEIMNVVDRKHAIKKWIVIMRIPDRHTATNLAPKMVQLRQQIHYLRPVQARRHVRLRIRPDIDHGVLFAPACVLVEGAYRALEVGPAHDHFAGRHPAGRHPVCSVHFRAQLLDHAAGAVAVLVAEPAPVFLAAVAAAVAVDAFPCGGGGEDEDDGAQEEGEEDAGTHFGEDGDGVSG